ncbi:hypothetical protein EP7_002275 [Isosphaeraceae bacterium EP7]
MLRGHAPLAEAGETIIDHAPGKRRSTMGKLEVSQKRIDANRRNALRSTGPKTTEGKEKSRRNSLVHGMAGEGVVLPKSQTEMVHERGQEWYSALNPSDDFERGLLKIIAVESVRMAHFQGEESEARKARARRATICWADERKAEIAEVALALPGRPEVVAGRLSICAPGCDWMIERWRALGHALDTAGEWTDEQAGMALDLLGLDSAVRELLSPLEPADGISSLEHRQALVDEQLERLLGLKAAGLDEIEENEREAAANGLTAGDDRAMKLLRRYEAASFRRMKWALDLMQTRKAQARDSWRNDANALRESINDRIRRESDPLEWSLFDDDVRTHSESAEDLIAEAPTTTKEVPTHPRLVDLLRNEPTKVDEQPSPTTPKARVQARQAANRNANLLKNLRRTRRGRCAEPTPAMV